MDTEYVKDFTGNMIGIIEYKNNGDWVVRDFASKTILGFYRKAEDHTTNFVGTIVSKGNTAISLIYKFHHLT